MKHANAEMIKAVADNTELCIFFKDSSESWRPCTYQYLVGNQSDNYFLCLPQHNESGQCLHWLNGGDVQPRPIDDDRRLACADVNKVKWMSWTSFMQDNLEFRIKPKKEKRWLTYNKKSDCISSGLMSTAPECMREGDQLIEIEVEV